MKPLRTGLCAGICFLTFASTGYAKTQHTVRKGDTLCGIAKHHKVSVEELQRANGVAAKKLKPGDRISIPGHRDAAPSAGKKQTAKGQKSSRKAAGKTGDAGEQKAAFVPIHEGDVYHTVSKGETLASIARKYSVSPEELREMNGMTSPRLKKNQKLLVRRENPKVHTVRKGDTIWNISRRYDMDVDTLMELNELDAPALKIGQKLYLQENREPSDDEAALLILARSTEQEISEMHAAEQASPKKDDPNRLVTFAKKLLNIPYKFGGNSFFGIDCSGYVKKVYGFLGVELPRTAREQFNEGETVEKHELSVGDLVFFRTYASFPSHVGIYLGNNLFIHASSRGKKVTIDNLEAPYYVKRFIGAKRLLAREEIPPESPST